MIGNIPSRPTGNAPLAIWAQWAHDAILSVMRPQAVSGQSVSRTSRGFSVIASRGGGFGIRVQGPFVLRDVLDDYLIGHDWDGTTEGTQPVYVAKQSEHRSSRTGDTIMAVDHTYTYFAGPIETWGVGTATRFNRTRSDDDGSSSEAQLILPPWKDGEIFWALPASTLVTRFADDDTLHEHPIPVELLIYGRDCQWAGPTI